MSLPTILAGALLATCTLTSLATAGGQQIPEPFGADTQRTPAVPLLVSPRLPSHVELAMDLPPVPPELPSGYTADEDAAVDAALLLPAIQAAREAARRNQ